MKKEKIRLTEEQFLIRLSRLIVLCEPVTKEKYEAVLFFIKQINKDEGKSLIDILQNGAFGGK